MQKSQSTIILTIMIMAVILAVGSFLALSYLRRRPEAPASARQIVVDGVAVAISMDPAKEVRLINALPVQTEIQSIAPTAVPAPDQPAQEPQPPPPTEIPPPPPTPVPLPDAVIFIDYVVQSNDYLFNIAQRMDTSIALMAQEGIAQNDLVPGQLIRLPIGNPAYCPGRRPYAVGEGDTVYSVGRRFSVSVDELQAINNLNQDFIIKAAGIICIP